MDGPFSIHAIRPCRLMLRGLALWQPSNASILVKNYNNLGYVMLIVLVGGTIYLFYDGIFYWQRSVNGILFSATFIVAFFCTKWHYRRGNYSRLMENELEIEPENSMKLVKRYNIFALILWVVCSVQLLWFFYYSFELKHNWEWILYVYIAVIGNGENCLFSSSILLPKLS